MPRAQSQKPRGIEITRADQDAIEAATPGWVWSNGYRAPDGVRRRGEGNTLIAWKVTSALNRTEVIIRRVNGQSVHATVARYHVPSADLPALALKLAAEYVSR